MATDDDSVAYAVAALRSQTPPPADEERAAPILDDWEFYHPFGDAKNGVAAKGVVTGSAKFENGVAIGTSTLRAVDGCGDDRPAWIRTQNTLYRLGWPRDAVPPVLQLALAPTWGEALVLAGASTGAHTLPQAVVAAYDAAGANNTATNGADKAPDWALRHRAAAEIAGALTAAGRNAVADAWRLLAVDARQESAAQDSAADLASALLEAAARDVPRTPEIAAVLAGWEVLGDGTSLGEDLSDPIAAARRIGERQTRTDNNDANGDVPPDKRPLLVRLTLAQDWWSAAEILIDDMPETALGKFTPFVRGAGTPQDLRAIARSLSKEYQDKGERDLADGWRLLAVEPANRHEVAWAIAALTAQQRAVTPPSDLAWAVDLAKAVAAWKMLAASGGRALPHPDDALASAWSLLHTGNRESPGEPEAEPSAEPRGVVVLHSIGGTTETTGGKEAVRAFKAIAGASLPLVVAADLSQARAILRDEFPHLHAQVDVLLTGLVDGEPVRLRPTLLVGEPGGGKSRLARRLAETLGAPLHRFDGSGSSDNAFGGTPRRWSTGEHCVPLEAVRRHRVANPVLLVDEIDKAGRSHHNGALTSALLPFLELENARAYPDPYLQSDVDLSHVSYILAANDDAVLPRPLRDRLRIVRLPRPTIDHLPALARGIVADMARERGGDPRWWPPLENHEFAIAEGLWRGGSVRRLRAIVERLLAYREQKPRH